MKAQLQRSLQAARLCQRRAGCDGRAVVLMVVLCCLIGANTQAQLTWRLSVKLILDAGGNPPTSGNGIGSAAEIQNPGNAGNSFLDRAGGGYQINLPEVLNPAGGFPCCSV